MRTNWLAHLITNWMGDDGFLKRLRAELRLFNVLGDTTWLKGKVTQKYIKDGEEVKGKHCPSCGNGLVFMEGCVSCSTCGWSQCG